MHFYIFIIVTQKIGKDINYFSFQEGNRGIMNMGYILRLIGIQSSFPECLLGTVCYSL